MEIETIYRLYFRDVCLFLQGLTRSEALAEELTQETFLRAITHADSFDGRVKMTTWLCAIAKNLFISHMRKEKRRCDAECDELPANTDISWRMDQTEIYKAVHRLPEPYREIVLLKIHTDMSFSDIGEIFGRSENWARVTFFRGKEQLRKILEKEDII